jgi:hypothetical protein
MFSSEEELWVKGRVEVLGSFRRGVVWAVGVLGHVASAIDTLTLTAARARWSLALVGWAALIVGSLVVDP